MLRKTMMTLLALAAVVLVAPNVASARGGFGGGFGGHGMGGGGWGGRGMGGGGWSGGRPAMIGGGAFRSAAIGGNFRSAAIGPGFRPGFHNAFHHRFPGRNFAFAAGLGSFAYYDGYYPYYDYAYDDSYYGDGGCYIVRQRVHTRYGWRIRPVQVCG
jgi:hypothetical protein